MPRVKEAEMCDNLIMYYIFCYICEVKDAGAVRQGAGAELVRGVGVGVYFLCSLARAKK